LPDIGWQWPDPYFGVPEPERDERVRSTSDLCVIDEEHFFIRGILLIPVHGQSERFGLGIWVSQSKQSFDTYLESFDSNEIGPFFGWLSNKLPFYSESTWALKTMAHFQGNGERPRIELDPCDHPLYRDIVNGISLEQAWRFVHWNAGAGDA
jgi:hypothetical protein